MCEYDHLTKHTHKKKNSELEKGMTGRFSMEIHPGCTCKEVVTTNLRSFFQIMNSHWGEVFLCCAFCFQSCHTEQNCYEI